MILIIIMVGDKSYVCSVLRGAGWGLHERILDRVPGRRHGIP